MIGKSSARKKRVKFQVSADPGSRVFVAGTFNDWNVQKHQLTERNGKYSTTIPIPEGRHEYKFVVNDVWCVDPECGEWTPNGLGSLNSVLHVS